jgi:hypothetical protein
MITTFTIGDEELDIDGVDGAYWHLDLLEGIEDHPSEDVLLLKAGPARLHSRAGGGSLMPATMTRDNVWSLWSWVGGSWHHMATSSDEAALRLQAESLRRLFTSRRFRVVGGASMPRE